MEVTSNKRVGGLLSSIEERTRVPKAAEVVLPSAMVTIAPSRIYQLLIAISGLFALINMAAHIVHHIIGVNGSLFTGVFRRFDLAQEHNLPAWFASAMLLCCSLLIAAIFLVERRQDRPYSTHWAVLSGIFFFMSIDEAITVHEWTILALRPVVGEHNPFFGYSWTIFGVPLVLLFVVAYFRFFLRLPGQIQRLFFAAGVLYVGGALGLELVTWQADAIFGFESFWWGISVAVKETCEMLGLATFIYALLSYLKVRGKAVQIALHEPWLPPIS